MTTPAPALSLDFDALTTREVEIIELLAGIDFGALTTSGQLPIVAVRAIGFVQQLDDTAEFRRRLRRDPDGAFDEFDGYDVRLSALTDLGKDRAATTSD